MKTPILKGCVLLGLGCLIGSASAEVPAVSAQASIAVETPRLPYGANDVVKLARAQVSEDIIVSYIQNSGTVYTLEPKDIVYLKEQGVSDRVLSCMLDQRRRVVETAQVTAPAQQPAPVYQQPQSASVTAPLTPVTSDYATPASSVYVIPYPSATYAYYGYPSYYRYPYYGGYYGGYYGSCYSPSLSFRFGFGGYGGRSFAYGRSFGHSGHFGGSHGGGHGGHRR
jgi:hypothetical protein